MVDGMGKLMHQNALGVLGIAGILQQILGANTHHRVSLSRTESPRTTVPIVLGTHVGMLGRVSHKLGLCHHRHVDVVSDQYLPEVGPCGQHVVDELGRFEQGKMGNLVRCQNSKPATAHMLAIEGILVRRRLGKLIRLHGAAAAKEQEKQQSSRA